MHKTREAIDAQQQAAFKKEIEQLELRIREAGEAVRKQCYNQARHYKPSKGIEWLNIPFLVGEGIASFVYSIESKRFVSIEYIYKDKAHTIKL